MVRDSINRAPMEAAVSLESALDEVLVDKIWATDSQDAWDVVFSRYDDDLRGIAAGRLGKKKDSPEVDDVIDVIREVALRNIGQIQEPAKLGHWLKVIARTRSINELKKESKHQRGRVVGEYGDAMIDKGYGEGVNPEEIVIAQQLAERMQRVLDKMPAKYSEAFMLHVVEGQSYKDIAKDLGDKVTPTTIKTRVSKARARLREGLERNPN